MEISSTGLEILLLPVIPRGDSHDLYQPPITEILNHLSLKLMEVHPLLPKEPKDDRYKLYSDYLDSLEI